MAVYVAIGAGFATLMLLYRLFFADAEEFLECLRYWLTPDILSILTGEGGEDFAAEAKLVLWFLCGVGSGWGTYLFLS